MHTHWGLALAWLIANPAFAAEDSANEQLAAERSSISAPAGPAPDATATELTTDDGIWSWICLLYTSDAADE